MVVRAAGCQHGLMVDMCPLVGGSAAAIALISAECHDEQHTWQPDQNALMVHLRNQRTCLYLCAAAPTTSLTAAEQTTHLCPLARNIPAHTMPPAATPAANPMLVGTPAAATPVGARPPAASTPPAGTPVAANTPAAEPSSMHTAGGTCL